MLSIPGQHWWCLEANALEGIAFGILYHHTADRELSEVRSKAFALEVLERLTGPAVILESTIDAWLRCDPRRPAPVRRRGSGLIPCAGCSALLPVAARHFALVSVFGTRCDHCRGGSA